jgi:hypothetical protein
MSKLGIRTCQYDREIENPVLHRPITHCVRPTAVRAYHPSNLSSRSWINREEETRGCNLLVQFHPRDGGLDDDIHVILVNSQNLVHEGEVDTDAAMRSGEVTFDRLPELADEP